MSPHSASLSLSSSPLLSSPLLSSQESKSKSVARASRTRLLFPSSYLWTRGQGHSQFHSNLAPIF
jgi:hypothetical protein